MDVIFKVVSSEERVTVTGVLESDVALQTGDSFIHDPLKGPIIYISKILGGNRYEFTSIPFDPVVYKFDSNIMGYLKIGSRL